MILVNKPLDPGVLPSVAPPPVLGCLSPTGFTVVMGRFPLTGFTAVMGRFPLTGFTAWLGFLESVPLTDLFFGALNSIFNSL